MQAEAGAQRNFRLHNSREQHPGRLPVPDLPGHCEGVRVPGAVWAPLVCHLPITPLRLPPAGGPHHTVSLLPVLSAACVSMTGASHSMHSMPVCQYLLQIVSGTGCLP